MTINSVLLAGAGAVGLTVADTLSRYNAADFGILAGGQRLVRYRNEGLWVNERRLEVRLVPAGVESEPADVSCSDGFDLIIIASKFHHLPQVLDDIAPYVGPKTLILSLLNGISSEQMIAERYGNERVPLAMILGTDAQHSGTRTTYSQKGVVHFGEPENPVPACGATCVAGVSSCSEKVRAIAEYFERAGLPFEVPADMKKRMWFKFMVNVGINQCSAVLRMPYAPFQHDAPNHPNANVDARMLMEEAMREVIAVASAEGVDLGERDIASWYETLDFLTPESRTSMCQDVCAGRKTEVELFSGTVISLAEKHGVDVPLNRFLYKLIRVTEQNYGI